MAEIKVIDEQTGEKVVQEAPKEPAQPGATVPDGVLLTERVAQVFDLKPSEVSRYKSKLNTLIDYAKLKTDDHSPEGLKWAIRNLSTKLGTPPMGEKLLPYLSRYAYLYLESVEINKEMDKYHDVNN